MSQDRSPQARVQANAAQFEQLAPVYDQLGFLTQAAEALAQAVRVPLGGRVLDVATGTGTVALTLAQRGEEVIGVDIAPAMLRVAAARAGGRVRFLEAEATALPFPDASFEVVTCGAGLFFVPDMGAALREWRRVLRPAGEVVFSAFERGLLEPLPALWRERLAQAGLTAGSPPLGRIGSAAAAAELLREAGFAAVEVSVRPLTYTLPSAEARWADIVAGLEGLALRDLPAEQVAALEVQHLAELAPLFALGPLSVPLPLIVARGRA